LSDFNKNLNFLDSYSEIAETYNFNENPSSESRAVPCGRTDGQTDVTKLIAACRNFAKAPKNCIQIDAILRRVRQESNINKSDKPNPSVTLD
jgi:hypothetical protein